MQGYFWNVVLAVNSVLWFIALTFFAYGCGMLIAFLDWRVFLLSLSTFAAVSLIELVLTGLAHD